ncbi:TetR family transcriptional regulator [Microbacterium sp. QXD-8]|uniref:TetR family transcriptional regulator n=1 Tax=Microbacterium psychrotolerans TaxID=3068321 RepID=A0ABU0YX29_9MICO|nr:TetR family transcriptional regulator [Microbacterium sp. QXD-8]MDQ7876882.1 TetR family transcriptional regulator [Microbacterium sp. QXD-8]
MSGTPSIDARFQRARSREAKDRRETAILDAARELAARDRVRDVTLTDIAAAVGMHKSAMLRYFETREEIFLRVTAAEWTSWADELVAALERGGRRTSQDVAADLAATLARRGTFCDLLAQAPLNLERNVSVDAVRRFKLVTHAQLDRIVGAMRAALPRLTAEQGVDVVAAATAMAGAFWQIATPGAEVAELYRADPRLGHALFDIEPRLQRMIAAMLRGFVGD